MININRDITIQARQSNLLVYLENKGYTFKREGKHYRCNEHSSLIVTPPNAFYWNSKDDGGNSVDFLVKHLNYGFKEAVEQLTNIDLEQQKSPSQLPTEKGNYIIDNSLLKRAYGYLIQSRGIEYNIISYLVKEGYIDMIDKGPYKHPVIGFKVLDEERQASGYEVQGTYDKIRFKGVTSDIKYGYGFNIIKGKPDKAFFFESVIDLISFIQLSKNKKLDIDINNSILISMSGLKITTLKNMLKAFKIDSKPFIAIDSDEAGDKFKRELINEEISYNQLLVPGKSKDWNEYLKAKDTGKEKKS